MIKTIIIFILIYYAFKFLLKFLFPFILKSFISKQQKKYSSNDYSSKKEGEVSIKSGSNFTHESNDIGEYVDFEEVKESK